MQIWRSGSFAASYKSTATIAKKRREADERDSREKERCDETHPHASQTLARSPELEKKIYEFVCVPSGHSRVLGEEHRESVVKKNIFVSKSATFQRNTSRVLLFPRDSTAENFEGVISPSLLPKRGRNASEKKRENLRDANTYELSALQQAVGHEFSRS